MVSSNKEDVQAFIKEQIKRKEEKGEKVEEKEVEEEEFTFEEDLAEVKNLLVEVLGQIKKL